MTLHVQLRDLGEGVAAIVECKTGERIQTVRNPRMASIFLDQWEALFIQSIRRNER